MATGHDRALRLFSVIQDQQSRELSQKHTAKRAKRLKVREEDLKLPRVTALAACQVQLFLLFPEMCRSQRVVSPLVYCSSAGLSLPYGCDEVVLAH